MVSIFCFLQTLLWPTSVVHQTRDGCGVVPQSPRFWLLVVRCGHQYTAELWGLVRESCCGGSWSNSECQRKGADEWMLQQLLKIRNTNYKYTTNFNVAHFGEPFFPPAPVFFRLLLMPLDWSMPTWWCWVMNPGKQHPTWVIWTSPRSR